LHFAVSILHYLSDHFGAGRPLTPALSPKAGRGSGTVVAVVRIMTAGQGLCGAAKKPSLTAVPKKTVL
ncbi:MAG TPA: hypothetical protein VHR72_03495, partial [Gemmataceae bacterium]|jgi:hypothetical protein|nr:hypothetical protein [Gemmataceae bacterium]